MRKIYERNDDERRATLESSLSTSDLVVCEEKCKKKATQQSCSSILCVRLSSASLFLPIASSPCDSLSVSRCASARARDTAPFTREASPPISRREIPYGKNIWRRETGARTVVVRRYAEGEKLREKSTLKADESRADRVSESTKFSNEDCDRHASSCTRRIDSIPRPVIYTHARYLL